MPSILLCNLFAVYLFTVSGYLSSMPYKSKETNLLQKTIGHVVRKLRFKLNLTQEEVAARAGLNRVYIGDLELGGRNLSFRNILRISVALETTPSKLLQVFEKEMKAQNKGFDLKDYLEKSKWIERG
jgi:DNA-binding XRE family transcriptional regulator